ncbi:MAG TPA: hypothetical protein VGG29_04395 [Caulobacteraceae bacterium]|jgi:hypothetical protein
MDLIDRYLDTVRLLLPREQRDDIAAELRDVLMSRREDREAELGRPLTRKENEAMLREYGHPFVVAARYGRQQFLIGPQLYPLYALVLKVVVAAVAFAALVTGLVQAAVNPGQVGHAVGTALGVVWTGGFASVGAVTVVFAILQRTGLSARMLSTWSVDELPRISTRRRRAPAWFEHVGDAVVQTLFLLWWTGVLPVGWASIEAEPHGRLFFQLAPIWHTLYWPVVVLAVAAVLCDVVKLATLSRPRVAYALNIPVHAGMVGLAASALGADRWMMVTGAQVPPAALVAVDKGVNVGFYVSLILVILVSLAAIATNGWRLLRPQPAKPARA